MAVEVTNEQIERVEAILSGIKDAPAKVFQNAINRALSTVRTKVTKQISSLYAIKRKDIRAESNIYFSKASKDNLVGQIQFSGYRIPLYRFNVSPKKPNGEQVKASVILSNGQTPFTRAFIAKMKSGHIGVFERTGLQSIEGRLEGKNGQTLRESKHSETIRELHGPGVPQMASNTVVLEEVEKAAQETLDKRIEHEIGRILDGYV